MPLTSLLTSFFGYLHFLKILHLTQLLIDTFTAKLRVLSIACLKANFVSSQRSNPPEKSKTWDSSHLRFWGGRGGGLTVWFHVSAISVNYLVWAVTVIVPYGVEGGRSAIVELFLWIKGVNSYCKQVSF